MPCRKRPRFSRCGMANRCLPTWSRIKKTPTASWFRCVWDLSIVEKKSTQSHRAPLRLHWNQGWFEPLHNFHRQYDHLLPFEMQSLLYGKCGLIMQPARKKVVVG